jgi:hypothetical protein
MSLPPSRVDARTPFAAVEIGVKYTSELTLNIASPLPHGDHTASGTSSCLKYFPWKGPARESAEEVLKYVLA